MHEVIKASSVPIRVSWLPKIFVPLMPQTITGCAVNANLKSICKPVPIKKKKSGFKKMDLQPDQVPQKC